MLGPSYSSLMIIWKTREELEPKMAYYTGINLVSVTYDRLEECQDKEEKLSLIKAIYGFYGQIAEISYNDNEIPPQTQVYSAIQLAKTEFIHSQIVDSAEEEKELLLQAYETLVQVKDIIPKDRPPLQFTFHSTTYEFAKKLCQLSDNSEEKKKWIEIQLEEAESILPLTISRPKETIFYLETCVYALTRLAEIVKGKNRSLRTEYLSRAYDFMVQVLEVGSADDIRSIQRRIKGTAWIANQIASLTKDPRKRNQWRTRSKELYDKYKSLIEFPNPIV